MVSVLERGLGGKMLGEAICVPKATPAAERGAMAENLMRQIQARALGGARTAAELPPANGARAFTGEFHSLVIDAAGNIFKGPNVGLTDARKRGPLAAAVASLRAGGLLKSGR